MTATAADIIAHRGASGYLPEHTLEAKVLAHGLGADYIEQDLVLSKDNFLIVIHDLTLNATTNVAEKFPTKKRADGGYYVIDFTLAELKQLSVHAPVDKDGNPKYPNRYAKRQPMFKLHTFSEELALIDGLNQSTGKSVGIYPEIKAPWFHQKAGKDIALATVKVLMQFNYGRSDKKVFLQSFDPHALKRLKHQLLPKYGVTIPLVQLIAKTEWRETQEKVDGKWQNLDYSQLMTQKGLEDIARYAEGIGPWYPMLVDYSDGNLQLSSFALSAKNQQLLIHPYTFRLEDVPSPFADYRAFLKYYLEQVNVDGYFTDFVDIKPR
ncbi:glycerophosphodiester phosphodiesterase [Thalassotalea agarivorans]|uniref:glycerophosphodiester phosphodiesterase n=1 Tax=Thalassotalea agarivorans TaxID=349064 RepID=UPI0015A71158|nr:glycerophosphodiester phosphodiesterase [Thalassotalea agarivorans]